MSTETQVPFVFELATHLPNGAKILERRHLDPYYYKQAPFMVLCFDEGRRHPYVTWRLDNDGNAFWGHYFTTYGEAYENYIRR